MPHANDNDPKKIKNDADFSKLTTSSSKSQGELSVYEIDILSYSNSTGKNNKLSTSDNEGKWKVEFKESELVIENKFQGEDEMPDDVGVPFSPLIESHSPFLKALKIDPDLKSVSYEISSEEKDEPDEAHEKFTVKEKPSNKKYSSLDSKKSEEKFKSQLRKMIIEDFISENDGKIKNLVKNLKKLENESVHFHHHEHHHYYVSSSKAQDIKTFLKILRSPTPKKSRDESAKKKQQEHDNSNTLAVNISDNYFRDLPNLVHPKIDSSNSENCNNLSIGQKYSDCCLPISSSNNSFLGMNADLVTSQLSSQTDFDKRGESNAEGEPFEKTLFQSAAKDVPKLTTKKLLKPEYTKLMESLKVLDKYLEPKVITQTKAKVSYIKCECLSEKEDEVDGVENRSSGVVIGASAAESRFTDESSHKSTIKTSDSDKNRYASYLSVKRSNELIKLKTVPRRVWAKHFKRELKDIKGRLRDIEKLYSKREKTLTIDLRGNELDPNLASVRDISVFSTNTYIMKGDGFSTGSSVCWI